MLSASTPQGLGRFLRGLELQPPLGVMMSYRVAGSIVVTGALALAVSVPPAAVGSAATFSTGAAPAWVRESPASAPPATWGAGMAFDVGSGETVLFGGSAVGVDDRTWTWDGSAWTEVHAGESPSARYVPAMATDPVREEVVLFGGSDDAETFDETWVFAAGEWTQRRPATSPHPRPMAMHWRTTRSPNG